MSEFLITNPDGRKFKVTGPDGSTKDGALQALQQHLGDSGKGNRMPNLTDSSTRQ